MAIENHKLYNKSYDEVGVDSPTAHRGLSFGICNGNGSVTEKQMRKWRPLSQ